ncbi:MAG: hypothetical protein GEU79_17035 [Acidimicrobiia bacterium]|nr:hypothetical protein [Acidimicrobiia bacterium]
MIEREGLTVRLSAHQLRSGPRASPAAEPINAPRPRCVETLMTTPRLVHHSNVVRLANRTDGYRLIGDNLSYP